METENRTATSATTITTYLLCIRQTNDSISFNNIESNMYSVWPE